MKNVPLHERGPLLSVAIQAGTNAVQGAAGLPIEVLGPMGACEVRARSGALQRTTSLPQVIGRTPVVKR